VGFRVKASRQRRQAQVLGFRAGFLGFGLQISGFGKGKSKVKGKGIGKDLHLTLLNAWGSFRSS
jgi:hypothetical protein